MSLLRITLYPALLLLLSSASLLAQTGKTIAEVDTNKGRFKIRLYDETPLHKANFLKLINTHAYDGVLFHRIVSGFMVQAGGALRTPTPKAQELLQQCNEATIPAEILYPTLYHKRGAVAAARTTDEVNPEMRSSGIQFFIVTGSFYLDRELKKLAESIGHPIEGAVKESYMTEGGAPGLDGKYTVFGEVIEGMKTIEKIQSIPTDDRDAPLKPVYIKSIRLLTHE